jgi:hypothetical protein
MADKEAGFHETLRRDEEVQGSSDRSFGLLFAALSGLVGLIKLWHAHPAGYGWLLASALLAGVALLVPKLLAPANRLWLKLGLLLHHVIEPVVMAVLFFLTVMPIGLILRLTGKDLLRLKWDRQAASYWLLRTPPGPAPESIRQQF